MRRQLDFGGGMNNNANDLWHPDVILVLHLNLNECVRTWQLLRDAVDDCWYIHKIAFKQFYNNA